MWDFFCSVLATAGLPCSNAFLFPFGASGERPPCIRQRPFAISADWLGSRSSSARRIVG